MRETSLFDGVTLAGWHPVPRTYGRAWPGGPTIAELFPEMPPDYDVNPRAHPATITHPQFDAREVLDLLGPTGHIALEVHDNHPLMAGERWAPGARCRWRNITIRELP